MDMKESIMKVQANLRLADFDIKFSEEGKKLMEDKLNGSIDDEEFKERIIKLVSRD